jgi:hypothetical protein
MAKFDVQTLKEQIAALIETHKELRQKIVDANEKLIKELKNGKL